MLEILKPDLFFTILLSNKCSLDELKRLLSKTSKDPTDPKLLNSCFVSTDAFSLNTTNRDRFSRNHCFDSFRATCIFFLWSMKAIDTVVGWLRCCSVL